MLKVMPVEFLGLQVYKSKVEGVEKNLGVNLKAGLLGEHIEVVGKDKEVTNL